jgi:DNA primase
MMTVDKLLTSKNIEFKPSGQDFVIRCLNPDHEDRNPSLRIDKTTGAFNCLSCGFKGNLFKHFGERVDVLEMRRQKVLSSIQNKLVETIGHNVPENAVPFDREWRGISADTFRRFEAFQHNNPEFIGRVVFPIRGITGKIVAFCGRHQGQADPKYLFYPPNAKIPLFPVVKPINGDVILVEGMLDAINLHDKGLTNAIAAFGVNKVTEDKINLLRIQGVQSITLLFDNDEAGKNGAEKTKQLLEKLEFPHRVETLAKKDPGELTACEVISLKESLYSA